METLKGIFQCPQKLTNVIQTSQNSPWLSLRSLNKWYGVFAPQYYKFSHLPLFHNSSIRVPFRFLTDTEVLQVSGLSRNFATISRLKHVLHSHTIRSFVGNSFHPKLISLAIGTPDHVRAWIQGKTECFFGVASPDDVRQGYISFRQTIENNLKMSGKAPKLQLYQNLTDTSTIGT